MDAVRIWCNKPHVANRNLTGSNELWSINASALSADKPNLVLFVISTVTVIIKEQGSLLTGDGLQVVDMFSQSIKRKLEEYLGMPLKQNGHGMTPDLIVSLRSLIPKQSNKFGRTLELTVMGTNMTNKRFIYILETIIFAKFWIYVL